MELVDDRCKVSIRLRLGLRERFQVETEVECKSNAERLCRIGGEVVRRR